VSEATYTVGIVVDPAFGDHLGALAQRMPVWVVDTPANRATAEAHWRAHPGASAATGLTTFRVDIEDRPERWCAEVLGTVVEHHGVYSHDPPVTVLLIIGARPGPDLREALAGFGFACLADTPDGFEARAA
jgi:hypothetical protein